MVHAEVSNPLNDPLNDIEDEDMDGGEFEGFGSEGEGDGVGGEKRVKNEVIRKLEEQALMGAEKKERTQSEREREWIERLVGRHGVDYERMARDRRLNPMQQTAKDIERRVGKWKAKGGKVPTEA